MNKQEADSFIRHECLSYQLPKDRQEFDKKKGEVLDFIEELSNYEAMWGWLDNMVNANGMEYNRAWKVQVGKLMYDLEQKYFPKEMKSDGR